MNGPKVSDVALVKSGYMLEHPVYPAVLVAVGFQQSGSDNLTGADNQQERFPNTMTLDVKKIPPNIGYYLAGFTDGEGSFNVSFRKRKDYKQPWKISLCFNVSQRDKVILALFKKHLCCGTLRQRKDGVWYYEVNNFTAITENVIPFFKCFGFLSAKKKRDFSKFQQMAEIITQKEHLAKPGIVKILKIRSEMNDGGKRKYSDAEVMQNLVMEKSSETNMPDIQPVSV